MRFQAQIMSLYGLIVFLLANILVGCISLISQALDRLKILDGWLVQLNVISLFRHDPFLFHPVDIQEMT